ncbi:MAG: hypothetical protein DWH79_10710 [Planctomycetota bacterium]|nr:MAG: hypothetical protein DWH79_10710 [Planctomycetota bacterium]
MGFGVSSRPWITCRTLLDRRSRVRSARDSRGVPPRRGPARAEAKRATVLARAVLLVIEVADTSLAYDLGAKVPLYARHGIPEGPGMASRRRGSSTRPRGRRGFFASRLIGARPEPRAGSKLPGQFQFHPGGGIALPGILRRRSVRNPPQAPVDHRGEEAEARNFRRIPAGQSCGGDRRIDAPAVGEQFGFDPHRALGELGRDFAGAWDHRGHRHRFVGERAAPGGEESQPPAESPGTMALAGGSGGDPEVEAVAVFGPGGLTPPRRPQPLDLGPHPQAIVVPGEPEGDDVGGADDGRQRREPAGLVEGSSGGGPERLPLPAGEAEGEQGTRIDQRHRQASAAAQKRAILYCCPCQECSGRICRPRGPWLP